MMKEKLFRLCALAIVAASVTTAAHGATIKERLAKPSPEAARQEVSAAAAATATFTQAPLKAKSNVSAGPTLRGWLSYYDAWNKNDATRYGIYSFPAAAATDFTKVLATANASAAADADGALCGYYVLNYGGAISIRYFMYEPLTGERKVYTTFGTNNTADVYTQYAYTLAYNHKDATLYGEFFRTKGNDLAVCASTVDPLTGKATEVAELNSNGIIFLALAFDNDGTLYGIGDNGSLYTLSLADGSCTLVGATGKQPAVQPQSAWYCTENGKLYWSYLDIDEHTTGLYEIDLSTGTATLVSDYPATAWIVSLSGDHTPAAKAPANVSDLAVNWNATASLDGTVTFTAPDKTTDGTAISTDLAVDLYIDYAKVSAAPASVAPGATYTYPATFAAGSHVVEVILKNDAGCNDRARLLTYAGTDKPGAVENLTLTLDGRNATLTWNAPQKGMYGGWFDPAGLSYKIVRRPDNVVVATGLTATTFSDEIPDCLGNWFYEVTTVAAQEGATVESNRVMYGAAMTVPYKETFETAAPLDLFTTEDVNNDGYYWKWKDGYVIDIRGDADYAADWLITPPVALTTDWIYKLTFDAHGYSTYYTETVNVGCGTAPEAKAMETLSTMTFSNDSWQTFETLVEIDHNGNYHFGIQHASPAPSSSFNDLFVDNIEIVPFISTEAPASVDNLKVTPLADNTLRATLSFTAPAKAINGNAISAISKIEVYRGDELILTDTAPGKEFSTEIDLPQGNNTFNVIAYNEKGRGHDSLVKAFGGIDIPCMVENVRYEWDSTDDCKATIMWDAPGLVGVNGYPINSSDITYNVLYQLFGGWITEATGLTGTSSAVKLSSFGTSAPAQTLVPRAIEAVTPGGKSQQAFVYVNLGAPYATPAYDSFTAGSAAYPTWSISRLEGNATWSMFNSNPDIIEASDNDNGLAGCIVAEGESGEGRLISPAFDFSSTTPKFLHIDMFHNTDASPEATLTIEYTLDGCNYEKLSQPVPVKAGKGWGEHVFPLTALIGKHKAMLGFRANVPDSNCGVYIDNLVIDDDPNSAIDAVAADNNSGICLTATAEGVTVTGAEGLDFTAYTPDGRVAASLTIAAANETITLPAGIYMVKAGSTVAKIVVK